MPRLYLTDPKLKVQVAVGLSLLTFLLLFLLQPFGDIVHGYRLTGLLRIGSYAAVVGVVLLAMELKVAPWFLERLLPNARYKVVFWYALEIMAVTTAIFLCKNAWLAFAYFSVSEFLIVLQRSMSIAIFPLIVLVLYLFLQKPAGEKKLRLVAEEGTESLSLLPAQLLCLKSEDNYAGVIYLENGRIQKKLLRGSLQYFESHLTFPFMRVHRSTIVNLACVESVKGNSRGFQLELGGLDAPLKVSKKYSIDFEEAWQRLYRE